MDWRDICERAVWTALQGGVGAITTVPLVTDVAGWEAVGIAAATAAVSSVLSFLKTLAQERLGVIETRASMMLDGAEHPEI